jgi:hypothetical protein
VVLSAWKSSFLIRLVLLVALGLILPGCAGKIPITGRVTVDDKPIKAGGVTFIPDKDKGNTSPANAIGQIKEDSTYELFTDGKPGAAPGWYKVLVTANSSSINISGSATPDGGKLYAPPESLVNPKYAKLSTTDLSVEVKPGGSYDLKLSAAPKFPNQGGVPNMPGVPAQPGVPPMPR